MRHVAQLLALAITVVMVSNCGFAGRLFKRGTRSTVGAVVGTVIAVAIWTELNEDQWKEARVEAKEESKGLKQYDGPRYKISTEGTKLAAMPLKSEEVDPKIAFILDDLLLTELSESGFDAIGPDDINTMLGFDRMKQEAGCDDPECAAEVGNALGVPYLTAGNVAAVEGSNVVTLKLINIEDSKVVARISKISEGGTKELPRTIGEAVQKLVASAKL